MSIHQSLKTQGRLIRSRNVWSRLERIKSLEKDERWQAGDSILGLPKVRTAFKIKSKKKVKEEAAKKASDTKEAPKDAAKDAKAPETKGKAAKPGK